MNNPKQNMLDTIRILFRRYWLLFLISIAGFVFYLITSRLIDPVNNQNSDFFTFWLSGHLVITGQNPYSSDIWLAGHNQFDATWIPNTKFVYPLPLALLFSPLGLLSYDQAYVIWVTLSQLMILLSFVLLLKSSDAPNLLKYIPPMLIGIALFRPTILTLRNGQFTAFLLFISTLIVYLWKKDKWCQGSALLPILVLKPNLGAIILFLLSIYLILQRRIKPLIVAGISGLVLSGIGLIQNPNWIVEFWAAGNSKLSQTFGFSPTIWGISCNFCQNRYNCTVFLGLCLALLLLAVLVILLIHKRSNLSPALAVSLAVTVTLMITPYSWPYDQLLLVIPIVILTLELSKSNFPALPAAMIFLLTDLLAILFLLISIKYETEIWNIIIPLLTFCMLVWYLTRKSHYKHTEQV